MLGLRGFLKENGGDFAFFQQKHQFLRFFISWTLANVIFLYYNEIKLPINSKKDLGMSAKMKTIFFVDDDLTNLTVGKNALAGHYNVFTFNSSELLFKMLEKRIPDLILLDVEMPKMDGYETIKILKTMENARAVPVVFLTAKDNYDNELEGLVLGAVDYIRKPFSPILLLKRIEILLLVEEQKRELIKVNASLQKTLEPLCAILGAMAEFVEFHCEIKGEYAERIKKYMRLMIGALLSAPREKHSYWEEIYKWDMEIFLLPQNSKFVARNNSFNKYADFGGKIIQKIGLCISGRDFLKLEKWSINKPSTFNNDDIPLLEKIIAIVDAYDAIVGDNPDKHNEAVSVIIKGKGKHFCPVLVDVFLSKADDFAETAQDAANE